MTIPSEEELQRQLAVAEAAELVARAEEWRLKQEKAEAEAAREVARLRELRAREEAHDRRRRAGRSQEFLRGEFADLTQQVLGHERRAVEWRKQEAAWREELDRLVLEQASCMARSDELALEVKRLEAMARRDGTRAAAVEAKVARAEERRKKDRSCVEALRRELEARRSEADGALAERRRLSEELAQRREDGARAVRFWRWTAAVLAALAALATLARATEPERW